MTCVALAEELHAHDGKDEDDDAEYEGEVAQRPDGLPHDGDEEVQRGPRLSQLEDSKLDIGFKNVRSLQQRFVTSRYSARDNIQF